MSDSSSNQSSVNGTSYNEDDIRRQIHVRRVREASEDLYSGSEDSEYAEGDSDDGNQAYEIQSQYDPPSSWQADAEDGKRSEYNPDPETESHPQSEATDSATVVTLYYPNQESVVSPDCQKESINSHSKETSNRRRFRFTPAATMKQSRAKSAPPAPLTSFQEFKGSCEFLQLEKAALIAGELIYKDDGKLDLDSTEGHSIAKKFLSSIETLMNSFSITCKDRKYREKFSQAYKILYNSSSLCYLTEILNSAQEGYTYVIVNSEKYIFSSNVIRTGEKLFNAFEVLKDSIKDIYNL